MNSKLNNQLLIIKTNYNKRLINYQKTKKIVYKNKSKIMSKLLKI